VVSATIPRWNWLSQRLILPGLPKEDVALYLLSSQNANKHHIDWDHQQQSRERQAIEADVCIYVCNRTLYIPCHRLLQRTGSCLVSAPSIPSRRKNKIPDPQRPQNIQSKPSSLQARHDNTAATNPPHRDATAMIPTTTCEIMVTAFINSFN
jgi:hypothetical protein